VAEAIARTETSLKRRGKLRVRMQIERAGIAKNVAKSATDAVFDGIVDRARIVALAGKPVADLLFGKLATGQQLQPVDVGCASRQTS